MGHFKSSLLTYYNLNLYFYLEYFFFSLPPDVFANEPPQPGGWARIVYIDTTDSIRYIAIKNMQLLDSSENLGAILRFAMDVVRPENEKLWEVLLSVPYRAYTIQQLMDSAQSAESEEEIVDQLKDYDLEDYSEQRSNCSNLLERDISRSPLLMRNNSENKINHTCYNRVSRND